VVALVAAVAQINPIWMYGPFRPDHVSAGSQPDWYMGFADGLERIMPGWEIRLWGHTLVLGVLLPLVAFGAVLAVIGVYPFVEAWISGDRAEHHVLDRPRNRPVRTGLGVAWLVLYFVLFVAAANDIIATHFHLSVNAVTWAARVAVFVAPPLSYVAAKRIALGLQRRDRDRVLHGRETGVIKRLRHGEYVEVHSMLSQEKAHRLTAHDQPPPLSLSELTHDPDATPSSAPRLVRLRVRLSQAMFGDKAHVPKPDVPEGLPHEAAPRARPPGSADRTDDS